MGNNTGVEITSSAHHNRTGGTAVGEGNTIAFNNGIGVSLDAAPFAAGPGNSILGNSIFSNNGLGIDLNADGVTANDACDADTGPNNLQNFPIITSVTASVGSTNIQGTLNSTASTGPFEIEFFSSPSCNAGPPNDFGEGQTFLGIATPSTDPSCNATFNVTLPVTVSAGSVITATATDPGLNTSEFSQCFLVVGGPTATPTNTPTNTPAGVATNTPTNTPTVISPTPTQPAGVVVPMLSPSMLGLLALVLIAAAFFVMRRL